LNFLSTGDPAIIPAYPELFDAFRASDPRWAEVDFEVQTVPYPELFTLIQTSVATGADVDILLADAPFVPNFAFNGVLMDLTDEFTDEELAQWVPASVDEGSWEGRFYAAPLQNSCPMMFYNRTLTDAAGISPPEQLEDSWTMEEAREAWEATTEGDVVGLRWGQGDFYIEYDQHPIARSAGTPGSPTFEGVGDDGVTFGGYLDTDEVVDAYTFYQELFADGLARVEPIPDEFFLDRAAFNVSPDNTIGTIPTAAPDPENFDYGITGIPYFETQLCHTGSFHWGVSPQAQNPEAAIEFVRFASGEEGSRIMFETVQQLPAHVTLLTELPEYTEFPRQLFADGLQQIGTPRVRTPCYPEYAERYGEMISDILSGADVGDVTARAASDLDGICAQYSD
jgi:fructooligosaccharide transport system substrate-binding protein